MLNAAVDLSALSVGDLRELLRQRLRDTQPPAEHASVKMAGVPAEFHEQVMQMVTLPLKRAAVLLPIIDRAEGLSLLFTERASHLRHHAGQISFPGGRIEPHDAGPLAAALRETEEEIGLSAELIDVLGYMAPQGVITGFSIAPVVALVRPDFQLRLDQREVAGVFEVPLPYLLNPAHHQLRQRQLQHLSVAVYDIHYGERRIWGATAGILLSLYALLTDRATASTERPDTAN